MDESARGVPQDWHVHYFVNAILDSASVDAE
jgi:hypothetical protein